MGRTAPVKNELGHGEEHGVGLIVGRAYAGRRRAIGEVGKHPLPVDPSLFSVTCS